MASSWNSFELALAGSASLQGRVAAMSRVPTSMELWWTGNAGSVEAACWYEDEGDGWKRYQLAPPGSAAPGGGVCAVSRIPTSMELWWIGPDGAVEAARWYEGGAWTRYQLAPAGSARPTSSVAAVSRVPNSMEVWWLGPEGSVEASFWHEGGAWTRYQIAPAGSAAGPISAVSRQSNTMELWWVAPNGSVQDAFWYEGGQWTRFELAPSGSAAPGGITAVSRIPTSMELWWIAPNGSVQDAFWYEGRQWTRFELAPAGSAAPGSITAVSRIPTSMELWWIAPNGSVQDAFWYEGGQWTRFELAPAGSATAGAGIDAVSRVPHAMELWWIAPDGGVKDAFLYTDEVKDAIVPGWGSLSLAGRHGASRTSGITALSRIPTSMEVWWITGGGSVEAAYWYAGDSWKRYQLAPLASAAPGGGIKAVSRIPNSTEVWWVGPEGSVEAAFWYEGGQWTRYQIAPASSAAGPITVLSRQPNTMELWWVAPNGSVQDAFWYEGGQWTRFELAPVGSAAAVSGIRALSRQPNTMELWWVAPNGSVQDAFWYEGGQWTRYELAPAGSAAPSSRFAAVSRVPTSMELWWTSLDGALRDAFFYEKIATFHDQIRSGGLAALGGSVDVTIHGDGTTQWKGHAHDSGADGYDFGITGMLRSTGGRAVAFSHTGHVGGTFTGGSRDHDWDERSPPSAVIAANFDDFAHGTFEASTAYSSDIGSAVESALSVVARWLIGSSPVGAAVGLVVFVGVEVGSLISTGSLVPGARVVEGMLWLAGPSNTLLALAAEGIASAGSRTRELSVQEYDWANEQVFSGTLPPRDRIVLTDTIGGGSRAFTFPRFDGKITLNMGADAYDDPRQYDVASGMRVYGETFIHELVHAWQIAHTPMSLDLMADALASKVCEATGSSPYDYPPAGGRYGEFNLEQQAQIVSDWFAGKIRPGSNQTGTAKDETSPYFRYVLGNIRAGQY